MEIWPACLPAAGKNGNNTSNLSTDLINLNFDCHGCESVLLATTLNTRLGFEISKD